MPSDEPQKQTLSGKTGPDCLWAMSCAAVCRYAGGVAASRAGQSTGRIYKLPKQVGKLMYDDYMQCFPVHEEAGVGNDAGKLKNVVQALHTAAAGWTKLPAELRDRWSMDKLRALPESNAVTPLGSNPRPPLMPRAADLFNAPLAERAPAVQVRGAGVRRRREAYERSISHRPRGRCASWPAGGGYISCSAARALLELLLFH